MTGARSEELSADGGVPSAIRPSAASAPAQSESVAPLVEHFFRHEAARLVSVLTRVFGWRNFDLVEDMVQSTLIDKLCFQNTNITQMPQHT